MPTSRRTFLGKLAAATVAAGVGSSVVADRAVGAAASLEGEYDYDVTETLAIDSFDDTTLEASLYEPTDENSRPAILMTHGWGGTRADREPLAELYASNGYVVLTYDSRGFGDSGGAVGVDGPNEVRDAQRLLTWLAERESVLTDNGGDPTVGMDGYSYGAGIQLMTAIEDDRLDALVPRWGWHDLRFSNDPNRVLKWAWFYGLYLSGVENGTLDDEFLKLSEAAIEEKSAGDELREFWRSRSPVGRLGAIDVPTLLISGWDDRLFSPNEVFRNYQGLADSTEARLLMYDYGHDYVEFEGDGPELQTEYADRSALAWMDAHLKSESEDEGENESESEGENDADIAPVTLYRAESEAFEEYDALPERADALSLAMASEKGASRLQVGGEESVSFEFDPQEAVDLVGVPRLWLSATPTGGEGTALFGGLEDVSSDGEATLIKEQVAATRVEREGLLAFDLIGIEHHLPADHTLRLTLTVIDDGLVEEGVPFEDGLHVDSDAPAGVVLKHSPGQPSVLAVPTSEGTIEVTGKPGKG
jgi:predicted acyl esterase